MLKGHPQHVPQDCIMDLFSYYLNNNCYTPCVKRLQQCKQRKKKTVTSTTPLPKTKIVTIGIIHLLNQFGI